MQRLGSVRSLVVLGLVLSCLREAYGIVRSLLSLVRLNRGVHDWTGGLRGQAGRRGSECLFGFYFGFCIRSC